MPYLPIKFNTKINGHNFEAKSDKSDDDYFCTKCNMYLYVTKTKKKQSYFADGELISINQILSCDEFLVKNILE